MTEDCNQTDRKMDEPHNRRNKLTYFIQMDNYRRQQGWNKFCVDSASSSVKESFSLLSGMIAAGRGFGLLHTSCGPLVPSPPPPSLQPKHMLNRLLSLKPLTFSCKWAGSQLWCCLMSWITMMNFQSCTFLKTIMLNCSMPATSSSQVRELLAPFKSKFTSF